MSNKNQLVVFERFIRTLENDISDKVPRFSGALAESIKGGVDLNGEPQLYVDMLEYGDYIDKGVNGTVNNWGSPYSFGDKMPPPKSLETWANAYNLNPWALAKSIQRKGIEPRNFAENVPSLIEEFGDDYIVAYWEDFYEDNK